MSQSPAADDFLSYVALMSTAAEPFQALRMLARAARSLRFRRELTPPRLRRIKRAIDETKQRAREGWRN